MDTLNINTNGLISSFAGQLWWRVGNKFTHLGDPGNMKKIEVTLRETIMGEMMVRDKRAPLSAYDLHLRLVDERVADALRHVGERVELVV